MELAALPLNGSWWGLVPAVVSVVFFWAGYKVDTGYLGFASIQLMTAALILLLGGPAWMRLLMMPWLIGASGLRLQGFDGQQRRADTSRKKIDW